jgi:hypothetical protein
MNAAVVLEPLLDAGRNLSRQLVMLGVDGSADYRRETGIDQELTTDDDKDPGPFWVLGRRVKDTVQLAALHGRIW